MEAWTLATALLSRTERHSGRTHGAVQPVSSSRGAGEDGDDARPDLGGRLQLGIGSGSIEDEHTRVGLDWGTFAERSERLGETLEILHQAFADERIDFAGKHFTVRDMPIKPGPVQQPRPPIVVGGVGREVHAAAGGAVCRRLERAHLRARRARSQDRGAPRVDCDDIGRDPATIVMSIEAVMALAPDDASLPAVPQLAEKRFGIPAFGLHEGGLIGTPPADRRPPARTAGAWDSARSCCSPMIADPTKPSSLLASEVIARL